MAKAGWYKTSFKTNARNRTPRDGDRQKVNSRKAEKPVEPSKPAEVAIFMGCSGIELMCRRGVLSEAQKGTADRFHGLHMAANANDLQGMDYSRVRVDGTRHDPGELIDRRLRARAELDRVRSAIGDQHFEALRLAVGEERSMSDVAAAFGATASTTGGRRVKRALDALGQHWGAVGTGYGIRAVAG